MQAGPKGQPLQEGNEQGKEDLQGVPTGPVFKDPGEQRLPPDTRDQGQRLSPETPDRGCHYRPETPDRGYHQNQRPGQRLSPETPDRGCHYNQRPRSEAITKDPMVQE